jgi:DNA-binding CsgD family transcriptional regulator
MTIQTGTQEYECPVTDLVAVYGWAVRHGLANGGADIGLTQSQLEEAIEALTEMRLLQRSADGIKLVPVSPQTASAGLLPSLEHRLLDAERALSHKRQELVTIRARLATFNSEYYRAQASLGNPSALDIVEDEHEASALLERATADCQEEILACQPGGAPPSAPFGEALPQEFGLLARGVRVHSLYQHAVQYDGRTVGYCRSALAAGAQIRIATELPPRMIIIDRAVAFLPLIQGSDKAVILREPSVVEVLHAVFMLAWDNAVPFGQPPPQHCDQVDAVDRRILQLLTGGLTDKAIAERLGIAERTCREHVSALYRRLGARSRFQAGAAAQALGLIDALADPARGVSGCAGKAPRNEDSRYPASSAPGHRSKNGASPSYSGRSGNGAVEHLASPSPRLAGSQ